jgi:predicted  nucleic acid-binding Zn-ribbon protein
MPSIAELWKLQEIDSALDARRASLADARERLGETEELVAARAEASALRDALRDARGSQKDIELEADGVRAKIAPAEEKLYGGTIRNPKELSDLQADIDQLRRHLSVVEDRDLEALARLESAEASLREAEARLAALEEAHRQEQQELQERIALLTVEIRQYEARRAAAVAAVDRDALGVYEHLRRAHQGRGVARLDRNLCTGCRISLPTATVNKARGGNALVQCPNCERILYA